MSGTWIRTYSGARFDPLAPDPGPILIDDIAHALSNICRYTGHCRHFYSVAQHSVLVSKILKDEGYNSRLQLQGLLHDATEAYLNDVVRPLKISPIMSRYREIEDHIEKLIAREFGFETLTPAEVKWADMACLATEARDLMGDPKDWDLNCKPMSWNVYPAPPTVAKQEFLRWYFNLKKEVENEQKTGAVTAGHGNGNQKMHTATGGEALAHRES